MSGRDRSSALKERLAYEAARIMIEQGLSDFDRARRKAAERTGILDRRNWPSNEAVHEAVLTQRRLFLNSSQTRATRDLRTEAIEAMRVFDAFAPRLVGAVLTGTADPQMGVELFLFADRPEDVLFALMDQQIPWQEGERTFRYPGGLRCAHPVFRFMAGDIPFELAILPWRAQRHPPLDPITERPQRGATRDEVARMLDEPDSAYRFEIGK
ncbi:hypothetical protein ThidrDRAFT_3457 [Thiorhodococcus drewsii AZ1]|uniref:Nucleotidyltransferase n=1 Tax=Thiorhodococcus drewsii AZ1 TaxID=765913 RepID=G2E594_9GAMM|nr:hypothetical protein [Thiorhodococcus drewsii]EGV29018.1 hypothetical protein ThidrDRAFT_3457 [Thiorhodococcus drewsii AZ1]